mmetsp:Transcript_13117/g.40960  ORF Transcript_13117/g.40960 Transcript_13117/m.40960 type:complete len:302 (+) Transcript_13117:550-1455(+)
MGKAAGRVVHDSAIPRAEAASVTVQCVHSTASVPPRTPHSGAVVLVFSQRAATLYGGLFRGGRCVEVKAKRRSRQLHALVMMLREPHEGHGVQPPLGQPHDGLARLPVGGGAVPEVVRRVRPRHVRVVGDAHVLHRLAVHHMVGDLVVPQEVAQREVEIVAVRVDGVDDVARGVVVEHVEARVLLLARVHVRLEDGQDVAPGPHHMRFLFVPHAQHWVLDERLVVEVVVLGTGGHPPGEDTRGVAQAELVAGEEAVDGVTRQRDDGCLATNRLELVADGVVVVRTQQAAVAVHLPRVEAVI